MQILNMKYFEGRNLYSHRPVLKIDLDMGVYYQRENTEFPLLAKTILAQIPSLAKHHCALGKPGGFVKRLEEGTYLGHIFEHLLLEILSLAGQDVVWGKTIPGCRAPIYLVIVECPLQEVGELAAKFTLNLLKQGLVGEKVDISKDLAELAQLNQEFSIGPSTKAILDACRSKGIPYVALPEGIYQLGYGTGQKRIWGTLTEHTSCLACDIAADKNLTKKILARHNLPILQGKLVHDEQIAVETAKVLGYPVTVKPNKGNHGRGVSLNLNSVAEVRAAYKMAYIHDQEILVERYLQGRHYRLLIVGGKLVACGERIPPQVVGDGIHSIRQLINTLNKDPRRGEGHEKIRSQILINPELILTVSKQKYSLEDILPENEVLILRENANLSCGAGAMDVTKETNENFREIGELAAKVIGLDVAGIDIVAEDISKPLSQQKTAIIEVNAAPGLRMHLAPDNSQGVNVGKAIVDSLFPQPAKSKIPLIAITGTNGKTTTTRLIAAILSQSGFYVGMTTTGGIFIDGKCVMQGDTTGPESAKIVLKNPQVSAAVLETARGGILRSGLGYDLADVAVLTNITEDHLGQDGIETMEDLAYLKALVAEAVQPKGAVVLNADDEYSLSITERITAPLIYFSLNKENPILRRHLALGGRAVFVEAGKIIFAKGDNSESLCDLNNIPLTFAGRAVHNASNVLAAVAAVKALNISNENIVATLERFGSSHKDNPGRLHIEEINGVTIIVDYGHNLAGYQQTAEFARKLGKGNILAVIGVPGDRYDQSIVKVGSYAGQAFDEIWIKEDQDLRGRKSGEVALLLRSGVEKFLQQQKIHICLEETAAVQLAFTKAQPGDVVIVFYEHLEPVLNAVELAQQKLLQA